MAAGSAQQVRVEVRLRPGVLDAEGTAVLAGLGRLGFAEVACVQVRRVFLLDVAAGTTEARVRELCEKLLVNQVIEDFDLRWVA